ATVTSDDHRATASELAAAGTVLLRNSSVGGQRVLPFGSRAPQSIAVIGAGASSRVHLSGHGSSHVDASQVITPLAAMRDRAPAQTSAQYASGTPFVMRPELMPMELLSPPSSPCPGIDVSYYARADFTKPVR